jgi:hypothetical protein
MSNHPTNRRVALGCGHILFSGFLVRVGMEVFCPKCEDYVKVKLILLE